MINLLPPEVREDMGYARRNTYLLHWIASISVAIIGLFVIVGAGIFYLQHTAKVYSAQVSTAEAELKSQKTEETQKRVQDISSSLRLVVQVLSKEVLFSKLIQQIGADLPPGAVLTNLSIAKTDGSINLTASTTNYQTATQVQVNLADPNNKLFEKADIININCVDPTSGQPQTSLYPCKIDLKALFGKNNPFLFINNTSKTGATP